MFGDKIPENYLIGKPLGKLLSCDNGIIGKILENLYEERIILPGIDLSRYLIERLLGNEMEDPDLDVFLCKINDNLEDFNTFIGNPPDPELGELGLEQNYLAHILNMIMNLVKY